MICYLFVIASLVLYVFAPVSYSLEYCSVCLVLYILNAISGLLPTLKKEVVNFGLLFSISLFLCSYLFPVVVYPIDKSYAFFSLGYNSDVINKCTALVNVAFSFYWLGVRNAKNKSYRKFIANDVVIDNRIINSLSNIVAVLFVLCIALGGMTYYTDRYIEGTMSVNMGFSYVNLLLTVFAILLACSSYFATSDRVLIKATIVLLVVSVVILFTGSRTLPMYVLIPLLYSYQKRYKISGTKMGLILFLMLSIFLIIGQLRHSVISIDSIASFRPEESEIGVYDSFLDFFVNSRNLYVIYDSVQKDGYLYGKNFLSALLSVVPFLQGIVSKLFNIPEWQMGSASFCTYLEFGNNPPLGLGTHIVGDIYLSLGFPGVMILFYALGLFVTKVKNSAELRQNAFLYVTYAYMLAGSVFMCRGSMFDSVRGILWSALILIIYKNCRLRIK